MWQRLGKNSGRYFGERIPIWDVLREIDERAAQGGWTRERFYSGDFDLFAYTRGSGAKRLYVSTGVHGDEPSGPLCALELFRQRLWPDGVQVSLVPCVNPRGFELNTRENEAGIDLNRDYRNTRTAVVAAHKAWLEREGIFDLAILLHEDWEANGFYVYELNPNQLPSLAERLIDAVRPVCPIETAETVDNWRCEAGIIRPAVPPEERPEWAEALWLIQHRSRQNYTLETPSDFELSLRVTAHLAAMREVFRAVGAES